MTRPFGQRLRLLRRARGLRVRDVADAVGISASLLSRVERGLAAPDDDLLNRVAAYFGEQHDELLLLAGRLPADLQAILQQHPAESALLLRQHFGAPAAQAASAATTFLPADLVGAMTDWAVRSAGDTVLDPSCGDGALLAAAAARLIALGVATTEVSNRLHGYDADPEASARTARRLHQLTGSVARLIRREDFLRAEPRTRLPFQRSAPPAVSVVLGAISGGTASAAARKQACRVAAEAGIELPESAPPWAALIVHAASFVRPDGRLALAVPAALLHAHYAADVRTYLAQLFPALTVVTFERPLRGCGEVAVLFGAADGRAGVHAVRVVEPAALVGALAEPDLAPPQVAEAAPLRWSGASLPTPAGALLRSLQRAGILRRLGDLVRIDAGVVTGSNRFFILSPSAAHDINPKYMQPALPSARAADGLVFRSIDWERLQASDQACYLLAIPGAAKLDRGTRTYLEQGERDGVPERATCRRRPTWYALPPPGTPAALLPYLCPRQPRMLLNEANVTHANALHSVQPGRGVNMTAVVTAFTSTAALLGCELIGRHYGKGVLKLEPAEVENLLVPYPAAIDSAHMTAHLQEIDGLWREGRHEEAIASTDEALLRKAADVGADTVSELRSCYEAERDRRRGK